MTPSLRLEIKVSRNPVDTCEVSSKSLSSKAFRRRQDKTQYIGLNMIDEKSRLVA
jgi:hypothetical protein